MITWVVGAMNPKFVQLMLDWLPEEPWWWLKEMVLLTDEERPDIEAVLQVTARTRPHWPITVRRDGDIVKAPHAPRALTRYIETLGVKVMLPLAYPEGLLFTDDDFVVFRDPWDLLRHQDAWGSQSGLDIYRGERDGRELTAWNHALATRWTIQTFNRYRTDAGVFYLPHTPKDQYLSWLYSFFASHAADEARGHRFRRLDQRFLSLWIANPVGTPQYRACPTKKIPLYTDHVPNCTFLHYCASGQKDRWVNWLTRVREGTMNHVP